MVYALSLGLSYCEFKSHQSYYCTYSLSGKTLVHGTNDISSTLIRCSHLRIIYLKLFFQFNPAQQGY